MKMTQTNGELPYGMRDSSVNTAAGEALKKREYLAADMAFGAASLFFGFAFFKLIVIYSLGLGALIFFALAAAIAAVYLIKRRAVQKKRGFVYLAGVIIFSINFIVSANGFIKFLDFCFICAAAAMWAFSVNNPMFDGADDYFIYSLLSSIFGKPFSNMKHCPAAIADIARKNKSGRNFRNAVVGLLMAVPVTMIVCVLLASADDNFSSIMEKIVNGGLDGLLKNVLIFVLGLPLSFYFFGMFFSAAENKEASRLSRSYCDGVTEKMRLMPSVMIFSSVIPLCIVYVIFFFSQIGYFLSAFGNVLPNGFSYSEYARQGFFELAAVAFINLAVLVFINLFCRYSDDKKPKSLTFFTVLISFFTLLLIATAVSKMVMYISHYGLTNMRIYTTWFMAVLAVLFVLVIVRQFVKFNLAGTGTVIFSLMLAVLSFSNVDALIVRYNVSAYEQGIIEELDYSHLYDLSPDAVYAVIPMLDSEIEWKKDFAECFVSEQREELVAGEYNEKWKIINIPSETVLKYYELIGGRHSNVAG